jgi:hypothetical protein
MGNVEAHSREPIIWTSNEGSEDVESKELGGARRNSGNRLIGTM